MLFNRIPQQYAPLGGKLSYGLQTETPQQIDLRICRAENGRLIGAKRFVDVDQIDFDAAPYLGREIRFEPPTGSTGFYPATGRSVEAVVEARPAGETTPVVAAPRRLFVAGSSPVSVGFRTSMPLHRLVPEGACDELTLFTEGACTLTVSAWTAESVVAESFRTEQGGLHLFRLDTNDFVGAERLTVDAGTGEVISYTVTPARKEGVRLAWRSSAGSVEHYTFPVVESSSLHVRRSRAESREGEVVTAASVCRRTVLESAYEGGEVLQALAELILAPQVWAVSDTGYMSVAVETDDVEIHRHGACCSMRITISPQPKNNLLWN